MEFETVGFTPGTRVNVVALPTSDPWIDSKLGWSGEVVAALADIPGHVRVQFEGRERQDIMPVSALRPATVGAGPRACPPPVVIPPDAPTVRVRDNAGSGDGEEHIRRRRGQVGRVVGECEIAQGFHHVAFAGSCLLVMIHKKDLVPVTARPVTKTTTRQLGLPM